MLFVFLSLILSVHAEDSNLCEVLNLTNCAGVLKQARRSSAQSVPSTTTAAQFNPANVSHDRGFGMEVMYQPSQAPSLGFVSGTGRTGAALVSSKIENAFFGNRVVELEDDYLKRRKNDDQYQGNKQTLALGGALFKNRKVSLDLGLLAKYNNDLKQVNPGMGVSARVFMFTFGLSSYRDDMYLRFKNNQDPYSGIPYTVLTGQDHYKERFNVKSYFMGTSYKNFYVDFAHIKTHYELYGEDINIRLYSFAYIYRKFLLNVALRHENSPMWKYRDGKLVAERVQNETYAGIQYSFNKNFILGLHHNYYLLRELAVSGTVFF